ncbi:hypothetical protein LCGC14_1987600 [marine sediment metagenome]|uniref:Uncharacterized protein n=1 Tax=marine sediment metagenome TaxID=412755 RepID=A0A0F9HKD1_9ZZZZ
MFWQREYIREAVSMTLNDTYKLDLPEHGLLGSLLLRISGSQASDWGINGGDWRIIDKIEEIEIIINGATVGKSLKGDLVQAAAFYDNKIVAPDVWRDYATNTQWCYIMLDFGRFLNDIDYGLDLDRHDNVEIRIKNNATTDHFSDLTVSLMGIYLRDVASGQFKGYLRTEEWRKWTTVADETKYLDLPTEFLLRRIIMQAVPNVDSDNVETTGMHNLMDDVELNMKSGQIKVYKGGIDDLLRDNYWAYGGPIITGGFPYRNADKGINMGLGYVMAAVAGAGANDGAGAGTLPTIEAARTSFTQKMETFEADSPVGMICMGVGYHNTVVFRFDYSPDVNLWLDPDARKTVELNIHTRNISAAASGVNKVILDRLVKY